MEQVNKLILDLAVRKLRWHIDDYIHNLSSRSKIWAATHCGELAGVVHMVLGDPATRPIRNPYNPLKEGDGWRNLVLSTATSVEISYVLVLPKYESKGISHALLAQCIWYCLREQVSIIELTLTHKLFEFYEYHGMVANLVLDERLGGGSKKYIGLEEEFFPAFFVVSDMIQGIQSKRPDLWKVIESYKNYLAQ